jgi:hypothetical protein
MLAAIYLLSPYATQVEHIRNQGAILWQAIVLVMGVLLLTMGLRSMLRRRGAGCLGDFTFADGQYLWEVNAVRVRVTPIHTLREARGTHHLTNGSYNYTSVALAAPEGGLALQLNDRAGADDVITFINACAHLRTTTEPGLRAAFGESPELVGEVARRMIDNRMNDGTAYGNSRPIPQPTGAPPKIFAARNASLGMAVAAAALFGVFAFPAIGEYWADEHSYGSIVDWGHDDVYRLEGYIAEFPQGRHIEEVQIMLDDVRFAKAKENGIAALEEYLTDFPQGRHAAEALVELDDRRFADAELSATQSHSPAALRDYLADMRNTRHREDAQKLIDGFYDEAIARLKSLGEGQEAVDPQLAAGLLALLESLKTSPRPVATIGFAARQEVSPEDELCKLVESQQYIAYLEENPGLSSIADASSEKTAILPLGEAFSDEQVRRREAFILDRLREAISKVINADIIAFEPAAEGQTPALLVEYRSYSVGTLYLYTRTETDSLGSETTTPRGLLRGYLVDWKLTIQPTPQGESYVYELASKPGDSLYYRPDSSDPNWAVYAVLMYSAFHDFSGKLISGMGLEAPSPPVSFSFADATGSHDTSPTYVPTYTSDSTYPSVPDSWTWNTSPSGNDWSSGLTPADYTLPGVGGNDANFNFNNTTDSSGFIPGDANFNTGGWSGFNSPLFNTANTLAQEAADALNGSTEGTAQPGTTQDSTTDPSLLQLDFSAFGGPTYDFNSLSGNGGSTEATNLAPPQIPGFESTLP